MHPTRGREGDDWHRQRPRLRSSISRHLTGQYDYLLHLVVRDIDHLGEVIKHTIGGIAGVEKQETLLVLSTIKERAGYSLDDYVA